MSPPSSWRSWSARCLRFCSAAGCSSRRRTRRDDSDNHTTKMVRPPNQGGLSYSMLKLLLTFDRVSAESRVLLSDLERRLVISALVPLFQRIHALPGLHR